MTLESKIAKAMQDKRRELIAQPLDRIWPELAKVAVFEARGHRMNEQMIDWGLSERDNPLCSVCGDHQFHSFHGMTCKNGHGGAEAR